MEKLGDVLNWDLPVDTTKLLVDKCRSKSIIIWGAGIGGAITSDILSENSLSDKVLCFVDNDEKKRGSLYKGKPVKSLIELGEDECKTSVFIISSTAFNIIRSQLKSEGVTESNILYFQPARLSQEVDADRDYVKDHITDYERAYKALCDDKSRRIFKCVLNYKISRNTSYLEDMIEDIDDEKHQYFDSGIVGCKQLRDGFVDAGAYDGDTVRSLYSHFPDYKGNIFCFEAEEKNYRELVRFIENSGLENIISYQKALWNESRITFIDTKIGGVGSSINGTGCEKVQCVSLDEVLTDVQSISFIKMDIEGAEKEALQGSEKIIKKFLPVMAICVYHKLEDLFAVWRIIESYANDRYRFYLRQYRFGDSETVLYAVPSGHDSNSGEIRE